MHKDELTLPTALVRGDVKVVLRGGSWGVEVEKKKNKYSFDSFSLDFFYLFLVLKLRYEFFFFRVLDRFFGGTGFSF